MEGRIAKNERRKDAKELGKGGRKDGKMEGGWTEKRLGMKEGRKGGDGRK